MKKNVLLIPIAFLSIFLLSQCETTKKSSDITYYKDSLKINSDDRALHINIEKGIEFNHPSLVIWKEDTEGNYLETIFITRSYATGIFAYAALTDSTWDNKPGESIQASALPYWTFKKGLINNAVLVPTKEHPFLDAYTGATPKTDFKFDTRTEFKAENYRILVEVNQPWDWNSYWTNNKYPLSESYKHSAQPSLVYGVTINNNEKVFYLNPIGHGDPKGESAKLYTDLSTISTAKNIFESIKIEIK